MKIFVYEHVSGGGFAGQPLPPAALRRGELMQRCLLGELARLPGVDLLTCRDARLAPLALPAAVRVVPVHGAVALAVFDDCARAADAVWLVAPTGAGVLLTLTQRVLRDQRRLLSSGADAVRLCADKPLLTQALARAGIAVAVSYAARRRLPWRGGAWVVKRTAPDGVGTSGAWLVGSRPRGWTLAAPRAGGATVQVFVAGRPCSLCILCRDGDACLLSCNTQRVAVRDTQFHVLGSTVNGIGAGMRDDCTGIARAIAACLPGLWGYVSVDLMLTAHGMVVLDVHPGMTLEWAGVYASTGRNPAQLALHLLESDFGDVGGFDGAGGSGGFGGFGRLGDRAGFGDAAGWGGGLLAAPISVDFGVFDA